MSQEEYTTKEAVENYLVKTVDDAFDLQLTEWIKAMSKYIDDFCGRTIALVPVTGEDEDDKTDTFLYDGDGTDTLFIKDCTDISEVKVGDDVVVPIEYPANKSYTRKLKLEDSCFTEGNQNVSVTGVHAMYTEVPDDIKFACTVLVGGICNNQVNKDKGTTERIGNYAITYTDAQKGDVDVAKNILNAYKVINI